MMFLSDPTILAHQAYDLHPSPGGALGYGRVESFWVVDLF
jgi:hypothetical protein